MATTSRGLVEVVCDGEGIVLLKDAPNYSIQISDLRPSPDGNPKVQGTIGTEQSGQAGPFPLIYFADGGRP